MLLIIAEKKSLANDIASALLQDIRYDQDTIVGTLNRKTKAIITYPNGHALRMLYPDEILPEYARWKLSDLPIRPSEHQYPHTACNQHAKACLQVVKKHHDQATEIVNACDAGREGELIFTEIMDHLGYASHGEKISRMWIISTHTDGIREAFAGRLPASDNRFKNLANSARARKYADWIYGINATRYVNIALGKQGSCESGPSVGRVKTPLLYAISKSNQRDEEWKATRYLKVEVNFYDDAYRYSAFLVAPQHLSFGHVRTSFKDGSESSEYISGLRRTLGAKWEVQDKIKQVSDVPPPPFSTIELQKSAFRIMGWEASYTMKLMESLYERERAISYPRTDSEHLPEAMWDELTGRAHHLWEHYLKQEYYRLEECHEPEYCDHWFDTSKCTDHYAIVPTLNVPKLLGADGTISDAYLLWDLIVRRFVGSLHPEAKVDASSRKLTFKNEEGLYYEALLKTAPVIEPGYLIFKEFTRSTQRPNDISLSKRMQKNEPLQTVKTSLISNYRTHSFLTNRPKGFNDEIALDYMERNGLGTAATRSKILEELKSEQSILIGLQKRYELSEAAQKLLSFLEEKELNDMLDPEMTRTWERHLETIQAGSNRFRMEDFLEGITMKVQELGLKMNSEDYIEEVALCPKTGKPAEFESGGYRFAGWPKTVFPYQFSGRNMSGADWQRVISAGATGHGPFKFTSKKTGQEFEAHLVFKRRSNQLEFKFKRRRRSGAHSA